MNNNPIQPDLADRLQELKAKEQFEKEKLQWFEEYEEMRAKKENNE